jgi:prepilin-type N-terminal cleavage/methylation domain-containing protein
MAKFLKKTFVVKKSRENDGFTLVELVLALFVTALLATGITQLLGTSVQSMNYTQKNSINSSSNSLIDSVFVRDVNSTSGIYVSSTSIPNEQVTNASQDQSNTSLFPASYASTLSISAVNSTGTYTYAGSFVPCNNQIVSISGTSTAFDQTSATIFSVDQTNSTFTITGVSGQAVSGISGIATFSSQCTTNNILFTLSGTPKTHALRKGQVISLTGFANPVQSQVFSNVTVAAATSGASYTVSVPNPMNYAPGDFSFNLASNGTIPNIRVECTTWVYGDTKVKPLVTLTLASGGTMGYEARDAGDGTASLWRVQCPNQGLVVPNSSQMLRNSFPALSDPAWNSVVQCTTYTGGTLTITSAGSGACTQDSFLDATTGVDGMTLNLPASKNQSTGPVGTVFQSQSILGSLAQ